MPNFDKTGPRGAGPKTGRGMGSCCGGSGAGRGRGMGTGRRGRGMSNGGTRVGRGGMRRG